MKKNIIIVYLVCFYCMGCFSTARKENEKMNFQYFDVAEEVVKKLGYSPKQMDRSDESMKWKGAIYKNSEFKKLSKKLINKDFIVIYYHPKDRNVLGGDVSVFIDRNSGAVLDILRGQ